jgi:hypothetical protein
LEERKGRREGERRRKVKEEGRDGERRRKAREKRKGKGSTGN